MGSGTTRGMHWIAALIVAAVLAAGCGSTGTPEEAGGGEATDAPSATDDGPTTTEAPELPSLEAELSMPMVSDVEDLDEHVTYVFPSAVRGVEAAKLGGGGCTDLLSRQGVTVDVSPFIYPGDRLLLLYLYEGIGDAWDAFDEHASQEVGCTYETEARDAEGNPTGESVESTLVSIEPDRHTGTVVTTWDWPEGSAVDVVRFSGRRALRANLTIDDDAEELAEKLRTLLVEHGGEPVWSFEDLLPDDLCGLLTPDDLDALVGTDDPKPTAVDAGCRWATGDSGVLLLDVSELSGDYGACDGAAPGASTEQIEVAGTIESCFVSSKSEFSGTEMEHTEIRLVTERARWFIQHAIAAELDFRPDRQAFVTAAEHVVDAL